MLAAVQTQLIWVASAFFIAIALNPAVDGLQNYMPKRNRGLSLTVVMLALLTIISVLVLTFLPILVKQTTSLIENAPSVVRNLQEANTPLSGILERYNAEEAVERSLGNAFQGLAGATGSVIDIAQGIFTGFAAVVTVIVLSIFMLLEGPRWMQRIWTSHPASSRARSQKLVAEMYKAISGYFSGMLLIAALSGIVATIMMTIVGVPYSVPLGMVVALLGLIPFVGATLAAVIVVLAALLGASTTAAIAMAVYFIIYQQLENNILQPVIQGRTTDLSPLVVTIAILLGVTVAGIFGALVAIPVAACIKVLISYWLNQEAGKKPSKV